mmetsp:Transcript_10573/g.19161  ORF Transcript_10573/g.19161 Transcript_10573/m.19161 type:complete len:208 (+) Transcript_10573:331-954(+)
MPGTGRRLFPVPAPVVHRRGQGGVAVAVSPGTVARVAPAPVVQVAGRGAEIAGVSIPGLVPRRRGAVIGVLGTRRRGGVVAAIITAVIAVHIARRPPVIVITPVVARGVIGRARAARWRWRRPTAASAHHVSEEAVALVVLPIKVTDSVPHFTLSPEVSEPVNGTNPGTGTAIPRGVRRVTSARAGCHLGCLGLGRNIRGQPGTKSR